MKTVAGGSFVAVLALMLMTDGHALNAAVSCESLLSLALPNASITMARMVPAGGFSLPESGPATISQFSQLPAFCRVAAALRPSPDSDIKIEVWLPAAGWNGKFQGVGNGGWAGNIMWVDRSGKEVGRAAITGQGFGVSLSPDGKRIACGRTDTQVQSSLWVQDLERDQEIRITRSRLSAGAAVVSPDGQRVAFAATGAAIRIKSVTAESEEILLKSSAARPSDWSRDGRWLVYTDVDPKTGNDIWLLPNPGKPSADRKPVAWLRTPALETQGQISPDGRWLAYCSDESGRLQIYLRPFGGGSQAPDTKWQVAPGREPRWRADGKELFWLQSGQATVRLKLMSAPIAATPNPVGTPRTLFEFEAELILPQGNVFAYAPSADGQRFVVNVASSDARPSLDFILNWGQTQGRR
jgi:hypothetical protein